MKKIFLSALFLTLLILLSPVLKSQTSENLSPINNGKNEPQFQFASIIFKISKKDNQYEIKQTESKLLNGVYKKPFDIVNSRKENDIICFILNQYNKPVDSLIIKNPFNNRFEYSEDEITIISVNIDLPENEALIRFNYKSEMEYLLFKKFEKDGTLMTITTIPINFN